MVFGSNNCKFKLRSGHGTKSSSSSLTSGSSGGGPYLRRHAAEPCSVEGSYKRTCAAADLSPAPATTMAVVTPITTIANATKTSVSVGVATQAMKQLIAKPNNITCPDAINNYQKNNLLPTDCSVNTIKLSHNNLNNINNISNCNANKTATASTIKSYVDLNCVATKLSAFEIKEALPLHNIAVVTPNQSYKETTPSCVPGVLSSKTTPPSPPKLTLHSPSTDSEALKNSNNVSAGQTCATTPCSNISCNNNSSKSTAPSSPTKIGTATICYANNTVSPVRGKNDISCDTQEKSLSVSNLSVECSTNNGANIASGMSEATVPEREEKPVVKTSVSVGSQATGNVKEPEKDLTSSPPSLPLQRTELVIRVNAATSDAASQTDYKPAETSPESVEDNSPPACIMSLASRAAQQEEQACEELSRDLASQLPPSDRLHNILVPASEHKKVSDYVSGLFRLDIRSSRPSSRLATQSISPSFTCDQVLDNSSATVTNEPAKVANEKTSEISEEAVEQCPSACQVNGHVSPTPNPENTSDNMTAKPLPADSAYFTTSEPKARFLTRYSEDISAPVSSASEDLQRKKEELMSRLGRKLEILREEQLVVTEETGVNEALGEGLAQRLRAASKLTEAGKLALHVEEVGKVTSLLLSLSGRLARAENAIIGLPACEEKRILEGKRDKLAEQLTEAKQLKANIDKRSCAVANLLAQALDPEAASDFEHFVHMKASLQVEARELADRVRLGEEQLQALRETLPSTSCTNSNTRSLQLCT